MKITVFGCGHLGYAFIKGLLDSQLVIESDLTLIDRGEARRAELSSKFACTVKESADSDLSHSDVVLLMVRPQDFDSAARGLVDYIKPDQIVISVLAGTRLQTLSEKLAGHLNLVRAMPNLPVTVGKGVLPFVVNQGADSKVGQVASKIFETLGSALKLSNEELIDAATAVSGSGPGYVFYMISAYLSAAEELGFSVEEARELVHRTLQGSVELWISSDKSAGELCESVRSEGGTTDAGLKIFEQGRLREIFVEGIEAAFGRARELGGGK